MALDALLAITIMPTEGDHFPLAVTGEFPLGLERYVEMDEPLAIGRAEMVEGAPVGMLDFQIDRQIGHLVRGELRQHGADRAQAAALVEAGPRGAQGAGRDHQPLATAIAEIGLDADASGRKQGHPV